MWAAPGDLAMHLHASQILGFAGVALASLPAVLFLTHALLIYDGVFIVLQAFGSVLDVAVLFLAIKYRAVSCPDH